tara:strand:- start:5611 stop:6018 length:408 start_codon:yes stop_codon:yes gene_type:complete
MVVLVFQFPRETHGGGIAMLDVILGILGIVAALIIHVIFLRITAWATIQEFRDSLRPAALIVVVPARLVIWATWLNLSKETDHPTFIAMAATGFVLWIVWMFARDTSYNYDDDYIKQSRLFSWLDRHKLLPGRHN